MITQNKTFPPLLINGSTPNTSQLSERINQIANEFGLQYAYNNILRTEVALGLRKPTLAIYDHTGHLIGGGQKYGFTMANALQKTFDVTLILNKKITIQDINDWYHLDLSACKIKIINLPFFDQFNCHHLDPARITIRTENPFDLISKESGNYDFFVNNSMNEKVYPLSNVSALVCHFPERRPKDYFYADKYTYIIYNSKYTAHWIQQKWKFTPHKHIYPPVDMAPYKAEDQLQKEKIILSVARFESGGSKKQLEMVYTFNKLSQKFPDLLDDWKLVLVGGSPDQNEYLSLIESTIQKKTIKNIELKINIPGDELKDLYKKSCIFWHLCGLDQRDPALVEHFGMTIVEAMQNHLVPIVFDGGGQREIVEQHKSGFRITNTAELMSYTLKLIQEENLQQEISKNAYERSKSFSRQVFEKNVQDFFNKILVQYQTI